MFILELKSLWQLIAGPSTFLKSFTGGVVELITICFKNQLSNFANAFTWFVYWADGFSIAFVVISYLGYLVGIRHVKRWDLKYWLKVMLVKMGKCVSESNLLVRYEID